MRSGIQQILLVSALIAAASRMEGQSASTPTPPALAPGTPAQSYALSGLDNINYFNGNLVIKIPVATVGARGSAGRTVYVPISQQWTVLQYSSEVYNGNNYLGANPNLAMGYLAYTPGYIDLGVSTATSPFTWTDCNGSTMYLPTSNFLLFATWNAPDGTQTQLWNTSNNGAPSPSNPCPYLQSLGSTYRSSDGTEMTFNAAGAGGGVLISKDGTQFLQNDVPQIALTDRNGNQITYGSSYTSNSITYSATDPAGRVQNYVVTTNAAGAEQDVLTIPGYSGPVTVNYDLLQNLLGGNDSLYSQYWRGDTATVTPTCLFPELDASSATIYNPYLVSTITLPDNSSYSFKYDKYGEVVLMRLPAGGAYAYTWNETSSCSDTSGTSGVITTGWPSGSATIVRRPLSRIELSDGAHISGQMLFSVVHPAVVDPNHSSRSTTTLQVDFKDASGTVELRREVHSFYGDPTSPASIPTSPTAFPVWTDGVEFQTTVYDGLTTPKVWRQQTNVWQQRPCNTSTEYCTGVITGSGSDSSRLHDPQLCQSNTTLETGAVSGTVMAYDTQFNNLTDLYEYGYGNAPAVSASCPAPSGSPSGSSFFRHTNTAYDTDAGHIAPAVNLVSLPVSRTVYDTIGTAAYDAWTYDQPSFLTTTNNVIGHNDAGFGATYTTRGNVTTHQVWIGLSSSYPAGTNPTETFGYDTTGSLLQHADFVGNKTTYCYGDTLHVSPTTILDPRGGSTCGQTTGTGSSGSPGTTELTYDQNLLKPLTATDENGVQTTYVYSDPFGRLTRVQQAAGTVVESWTRYSYTPYSSPSTWAQVTTLQDENATDDSSPLKTVATFDGLGRQTKTDVYESTSSYIETTAGYDALGRVYQTTNPSRSGDGLNYATAYSYDALNRPNCATTADSSSTCVAYAGNVATTTQKATDVNVVHQTTTDAGGRVLSVQENPGTGSYLTSYTLYDGLNNLRSMMQGTSPNTQSRTFTYDSLGRLTVAVNPENGTTSYAYDADSNLIYRKDNASRQTCYQYDQVNRITMRLYYTGTAQIGTPCPSITNNTATPTVSFLYDAGPSGADVPNSHGRLTQVLNSSSGNQTVANELVMGYDALGRITGSSEALGTAQSYNFLYGYNFAGELTSMTYPSSRVVTTGYDGAGRISSLTGTPATGSPTTYLSAVSYWPHGAFESLTFANQLQRSYSFNLQLQPTEIKDTQGGNQLLDLQYFYGGSTMLGASSATNNGSPTQLMEKALRTGLIYTFTQTNHFDGLNRLTSANDSGGWSHNYGYDPFGNMWLSSYSGPPQSPLMPTLQSNINAGTNRVSVSGVTYDGSGLGTAVVAGSSNLTYDAENRVVSAADNTGSGAVVNYVYDGLGQRVSKSSNAAGVSTTYLYDAFGNLAAEYTSGTVPAPPWITCYISDDALGNTRMVTDQTGAVQASHDYYPFGAEVAGTTAQRSGAWGTTDYLSQKFTGEERDTETGLDHFPARHFASAMGRFMVPDPAGNFVASVTNPQSWNMYSYAGNNPLKFVDPSGLCYQGDDGTYYDDDGVACDFSAILQSSVTVEDTFAPVEYDYSNDSDSSAGSGGGGGFGISYISGGGFGLNFTGAGDGSTGGGNPLLQNVSSTTKPCSQNPVSALRLDYSQLLYKGGTQTTEEHIQERHLSGKPGVSQYIGPFFFQIESLNALTYVFSPKQELQGGSVVFQLDLGRFFPNEGIIGTGTTSQPTAVNRLVVLGDCKTVVMSYPVSVP